MKKLPTINAGSMADIAFTLLIFFLVSTTLAIDKGQRVNLPPWNPCEGICDKDIYDPDLLVIEILNNNDLLLEDQLFPIEQIQPETMTFLLNEGKNPNYSTSLERALVLIKINSEAEYSTYLEVYSKVKGAFTEIRIQKAKEVYNLAYAQLNDAQAREIRQFVPLKIVEQTVID